MEVPRAIWHWHGTDNRLAKFGTWVECTSLITITHQNIISESCRHTGALLVLGTVIWTLSLLGGPTQINKGSTHLYRIHMCVVISRVNWTSSFHRVMDNCDAGESEEVSAGTGVDDWPYSKDLCRSWQGAQSQCLGGYHGSWGEQNGFRDKEQGKGPRVHLVSGVYLVMWVPQTNLGIQTSIMPCQMFL